MEKQNIQNTANKLFNRNDLVQNFINEIKVSSIDQIKLELDKLNYLALNYDPYQGVDFASDEEKNILNNYKLMDYLDNPFDFTNILLQFIDLAQEEQSKRLQ